MVTENRNNLWCCGALPIGDTLEVAATVQMDALSYLYWHRCSEEADQAAGGDVRHDAICLWFKNTKSNDSILDIHALAHKMELINRNLKEFR